jgi:NDP-sugar pyrophosphorylase family protein
MRIDIMRGFVLAAGFGTRLKPITDVIPKAMVSVCGVPLVEIAIRYLRKNGFEQYAVNTHYLAEFVEMTTQRLPYDVTVIDEQPKILGTGGAIYNARSFLKGDSFAVLNADIVTNTPLLKLVKEFEESDNLVALISTTTSGAHSITSVDGFYNGPVQTPYQEGGKGSAFIGLTLYKKEALEYFKEDDFSVLPIWKRMVDAGEKVAVIDCLDIYWQDTGTPKDLTQLYWDILDKRLKFDFPLGVEVDYERKIGISGEIDKSVISDSSSYLWVENVLGDKISGNRTVIHGGVSVDSSRDYKDVIVTPWCEVHVTE